MWGHPTNSLVGHTKRDSDMSPADSLRYFGINKVFYVPMHRPTDMPQCNKELAFAEKVGWSIESIADIDKIIGQSKEFPNISIGVFDDFFSEDNKDSNYKNYSEEQLKSIRDKLHEAGLEMWVVFYSMQIDNEAQKLLSIFDGVTFWFWDEPTKEEFIEKSRWFINMTKGQKRLMGCYLFNFSKSCEVSAEMVLFQLEKNKELMQQGILDGVILHTNAVGNLGYEAFEAAKKWLDKEGDTLV